MRFGQISPNLSAKTESSVKNLIAARNMKNQAMRGIVGFVNKAADEKIQKEKDAASLERATALIKQVQAAYPTNVAIQNLDPNTVGKELGKEGIGLINMLAQADLTQKQTEEQIRAAKAAQVRDTVSAKQAVVSAQILRQKEIDRRRDNRTVEDTEDVSSKALSIYTTQRKNEEKSTGNRLLDMEVIVSDLYKDLPADERAFVDKEKAVTAAVDRSTELEGESIDLAGKALDQKQKEQLLKITNFEIEAAQQKALAYANESEANFRQVSRSTNNLISQQENILNSSLNLKNAINTFRKNLKDEGRADQEIREELTKVLQGKIAGTDARRINAAATQLASQIGTATLLEMRSVSEDGSSGFGQLTGIELQTLQSMFGILGTIQENTFVAVDLLTLENSINSIETAFAEKIANTRYDFQQNFPVKYKTLPEKFYRSLMSVEGEL
jgi:hypothetical protein